MDGLKVIFEKLKNNPHFDYPTVGEYKILSTN